MVSLIQFFRRLHKKFMIEKLVEVFVLFSFHLVSSDQCLSKPFFIYVLLPFASALLHKENRNK